MEPKLRESFIRLGPGVGGRPGPGRRIGREAAPTRVKGGVTQPWMREVRMLQPVAKDGEEPVRRMPKGSWEGLNAQVGSTLSRGRET